MTIKKLRKHLLESKAEYLEKFNFYRKNDMRDLATLTGAKLQAYDELFGLMGGEQNGKTNL